MARIPYQAFIDGLRAIAVIAVMLYHLKKSWLPGGFIGVDIFFVISGFVVSASVSHWVQGSWAQFLASFYARRMQRIVPALLACLLVTSAVSMLVIPSAWLSSSNELTGLFAFFALSNVFLAFQSEAYFSPGAEFNPYMHTWSLGVEEQFYLILPLLFFAWTRGGRWRTVSAGLAAFALLASLGSAWIRSGIDSTASFYLITTRFWELGTGVLLFQYIQLVGDESRFSKWQAAKGIASWFFLGLFAFCLVALEVRQFPFPGALLPVVATLGLLGALYDSERNLLLSRLLGSTVPTYIGRRSYSLYLWHWPVYVIMRWTCGLDSIPLAMMAAAATFAIAELSYRYIECPFRYWKRMQPWSRPRVIAAGLAVIVVACGSSAAISLAKKQLSLSTVSRNVELWYANPLTHVEDLPGCTLTAREEPANPAAASTYSRSGCVDASTAAPDVYAIGDSHAVAYTTLLTEYVLRTGARVTIYPNKGCTFASLQPQRESGPCPQQNQAQIEDILRRSKRGDILFLSAMRLDRLSNQDAELHVREDMAPTNSAENAQARYAAESALRSTLQPFVKKGVHMVFEAPTPLFRASPFRCSDFFNTENPSCSGSISEPRAFIEEYRRPTLESLERLATQLDATVWDPLPVLCNEARCDAIRDGKPLFFDGDHLSGFGNRLLFPSFLAMVESASNSATR